MPTYAVQYVYSTDTDRVSAVRPEHRAFLRGLLADGALLASGPWGTTTTRVRPDGEPPTTSEEPPGALLLLRARDEDDVAAILDPDPFWVTGLITSRTVRTWDPVVGPFAS